MDNIELFQLTARLRRFFPRHIDILALCDEAERLVRKPPVIDLRENAGMRGAMSEAKRDRAAYMRAYRAKRRSNK